MYYPYLRGKQFDLLALTALINEKRWSHQIVPIIEPVRDSATLKKTIELFDQMNLSLYIVENPQVGTFKLFNDKKHTWILSDSSSVKKARIITETDLTKPADLFLFNEHSPRTVQQIQHLMEQKAQMVIPDQGRFRILPVDERILLQESFQPRRHIADYGIKEDDFFTDNHLYYLEDGFSGYSDYTIEGSHYFDKGGPSRAIAIHVTYFDAYLNLRVKHFVSDTNDSAKDQGVKFNEALIKLSKWYYRNQDQLLLTLGLQQLLSYEKEGKFPGLGTIKKWSLAHHLELLSSFFDHGDHWMEGMK
ncbi:sce7725 family protein [Candidatus Enterococcus ferrettii]|uniref:Sce7725 family protein n=1 Tax=Candidatus Enterococcus ferrettii TaxID=2815324 RepID=A0ABV0EPX9_9ENTE|nr:sce7725 family protein [Enterococcus sp. 665A]MBO1341177.1 sce7725 family protein [Enterococcus sp. 665A]